VMVSDDAVIYRTKRKVIKAYLYLNNLSMQVLSLGYVIVAGVPLYETVYT